MSGTLSGYAYLVASVCFIMALRGLSSPETARKGNLWGIAGMLHDFDYEQNPTEDTHLHVGCRILRERGYPEEIVLAIASHADYMGVPRDTPLRKALYGCDELVGFVGACVKVRPTKKIADLPVESVTKKLKDKAFARSVDRACVYGGAEGLGRQSEGSQCGAEGGPALEGRHRRMP